jgi:hypothetical protein
VTRAFRARAGGLALRGQCLMVDGLARPAAGPSANSSGGLARHGLSFGRFVAGGAHEVNPPLVSPRLGKR